VTPSGPYLAVIGPAEAGPALLAVAEEVGRLIAQAGAVLLSGGLGGVMEAACRGARQAGGVTIGLLPGTDRATGNAYLTVALPTGLGQGRNLLLIRGADAIVCVGGSWGTLSEVAMARRTAGKPVVILSGWSIRDVTGAPVEDGLLRASDPAEAVRLALHGTPRAAPQQGDTGAASALNSDSLSADE
jgi:uncharacterized protein (TIGR00725 family)